MKKAKQRSKRTDSRNIDVKLEEAREMIRAIHSGEVDALVVSAPEGSRVYTLQGAEHPYHVIVDTMSEGALTLLFDGTILYANARFARLLGLRLENVVGSSLLDHVCDEDRETLTQLLERAKRDTVRRDLSLRTSSGKPRPVYISVAPLKEKGFQSACMVVTDLSRLKAAERKLRKAHDELEARVARRTKELCQANADLRREIEERRRAEDALARSNHDLEQFAYVASHDLQEPLRMVTGFVELLRKRYAGKLDARADEYIGFAFEGAIRMQQLIKDLLAFSRAGMQEQTTLSTVDANVVLTRALSNLKNVIEECQARIVRRPLPKVWADPTQLMQLFQNLLTNALKFRPPNRKPRVYIGARRGRGEWIFSVKDNGIGIDREHIKRVFLIFQRLHARTDYPGTGIGLAICKKIVDRHGGRIWVESQPGKGSTFFFTVPDRMNENS